MRTFTRLLCILGLTLIASCHAENEQKRVPVEPKPIDSKSPSWAATMAKASKIGLDSKPSGKDPQPEGAGKQGGGAVSSHVVGGTVTTRGQYPWTAHIQANNYIYGGSLIHGQWVLTAGSVAKGATNFTISLGVQDRSVYFENGRVVLMTTTKFVHPNFTSSTSGNDIALIKLPIVVPTPTSYINVIQLPRNSDATVTFAGTTATLTGWGVFNTAARSLSPNLNAVAMPVITNTQCTTKWGSYIKAGSICTDFINNRTACNSDEGGPLMYKETATTWTQIGVYSFTNDCVNAMPPVFTRVTAYLGWISSITGIAIRA